jgi:TonB family protein
MFLSWLTGIVPPGFHTQPVVLAGFHPCVLFNSNRAFRVCCRRPCNIRYPSTSAPKSEGFRINRKRVGLALRQTRFFVNLFLQAYAYIDVKRVDIRVPAAPYAMGIDSLERKLTRVNLLKKSGNSRAGVIKSGSGQGGGAVSVPFTWLLSVVIHAVGAIVCIGTPLDVQQHRMFRAEGRSRDIPAVFAVSPRTEPMENAPNFESSPLEYVEFDNGDEAAIFPSPDISRCVLAVPDPQADSNDMPSGNTATLLEMRVNCVKLPRQAATPDRPAGGSEVISTALAPAVEGPPAIVPPGYSGNSAPAYPPLARRMGYEGLVLLAVKVSGAGEPLFVEVKTTSGRPILDAAAVAAVRKWRFSPATADGRPIEATVEVPVRFKLVE